MTELGESFAKADEAFAEMLEKPAAYWFGGDGEDTADVSGIAYVVKGDGRVTAVNVEVKIPGLEDVDGVVYMDTHEYRISSYLRGSRHMDVSLPDIDVFEEVTAHYAKTMPEWYRANPVAG